MALRNFGFTVVCLLAFSAMSVLVFIKILHPRDSRLMLTKPLNTMMQSSAIKLTSSIQNVSEAEVPVANQTSTSAVVTTTMTTTIHLAVAACGDRANQTRTMIKSALALMTGQTKLVVHVFMENHMQRDFGAQIETWPERYLRKMALRMHNITFPINEDQTHWLQIFWRRCAFQRMFLHTLLPDVDAIIYLDTDTLFMTSITHVWSLFSEFNSTQMLGMAANHENIKGGGHYPTRSQVPFVRPSGLNSGVILMNLTRLRGSRFSERVLRYSKVYRETLRLVDQDLYNIYLLNHPDHLFLLDCSLNYRADHCFYRMKDATSACLSAEREGVQILHGSRCFFSRPTTFRSVYMAFFAYTLGKDLRSDLLFSLRKHLLEHSKAGAFYDCTPVILAFEKRLIRTIQELLPPSADLTMAKPQLYYIGIDKRAFRQL